VNYLDFHVTNGVQAQGNPSGLLMTNLQGSADPVPEPGTLLAGSPGSRFVGAGARSGRWRPRRLFGQSDSRAHNRAHCKCLRFREGTPVRTLPKEETAGLG
jgi:hypothetical protein